MAGTRRDERRAEPGGPRDLGFGSVVTERSRLRLLNKDGSFNIQKRGLGYVRSLSLFHALLTMSWWRFVSLVGGGFLTANVLFALAYLACGHDALGGTADALPAGFLRAFFFSVQTSATIGYGHVHPVGLAANTLVVVEALASVLALAIATGIAFARFSRPTARILFSRKAVIAPYHGGLAFEFRIVNERRNEIVELEAQVLFSLLVSENGRRLRRFTDLPLERRKVVFFPLSWTIVHPIDGASPLSGLTPDDLAAADAEFLVLLTGIDETFSQTVHARSSYKPDEIVWDARFREIFLPEEEDGRLRIDVGRLSDVVPAGSANAGASGRPPG